MNTQTARRTKGAALQNRRLLLSYLRSYAIVLVIPFLLSLLFYFFSLNQARRAAIHQNDQVLATAAAQVDIHLQEVESIAREIISNPAVRAYQWKATGFDYPNAYRMIEVRNSLGNYTLTQGFISQYFLLFNDSRIALSNSFIYTYDDFFKNYLRLPDGEREAFLEGLEARELPVGLQPARPMRLLSQEERRYLMLIEPLVDLGNGYVCMLIDEANITSFFRSINLGASGCAYVMNDADNVIASLTGDQCDFDGAHGAVLERIQSEPERSGFTLSLSGSPMLVNRTFAGDSAMTYVSVQPLDIIFSQVYHTRNLMLAFFAVALLLGAALCLQQASHAATPLGALMEAVGFYSGDSAEALGVVRDIVSDLQADNDDLQRIAGEHKLLLRSSFTGRLLRGSFSSDAEANRLAQIVIPEYADFSAVRVLLFHLAPQVEDGGEDIRLKLAGSMKVALRDKMDREIDTSLTYDIDEETLALVVFNQDHPGIEAFYARLREELPQAIRDSLTVYGGISCPPPLVHVARSFESARVTMATYLLSGEAKPNAIAWSDHHVSATQYFLPPDMRYQLTEAVVHGMQEDVEALLSSLIQANLVDRPLKPTIFRLFISDLVSTGVSCLPLLPNPPEDDGVSEMIDGISKASLRRQPELILAFFRTLTACAEAADGEYKLLVRQVMDYIAANYADSSLSLTSIAEAFSMNPSVLSTTFKQQTGKNLSAWLEDVRIKEAQRLLRTTDWTINRISEEVGYLSASTFCRAFRRNTGKNTSTYKAQTDLNPKELRT